MAKKKGKKPKKKDKKPLLKKIGGKIGKAAKALGIAAAVGTVGIPAAILIVYPKIKKILKSKGINPEGRKIQENLRDFYRIVIKREKFEFAAEAVTMSAIIKSIIEFFRDLAKKKKEGKITEKDGTINELADAGIAMEEKYQEIKKEETTHTIGNFVQKYGVLILAGGIALFLLARRK